MKKKIRLIAPVIFIFSLGLTFEQAKTNGGLWYILIAILVSVWLFVGNKLYNEEGD